MKHQNNKSSGKHQPFRHKPYPPTADEAKVLKNWFHNVEHCDASSIRKYEESIRELTAELEGLMGKDFGVLADEVAAAERLSKSPDADRLLYSLFIQGIALRRALWDAQWRERRIKEIHEELEQRLDPVKWDSLHEELDSITTPAEAAKWRWSDQELLAIIASQGPPTAKRKAKTQESTHRIQIGLWHGPMTQNDYARRLGLSRDWVTEVLKRMKPRPKPLNVRSSARESKQFGTDDNFRAMEVFLKKTKRGDDWCLDYIFTTIKWYKKEKPKLFKDAISRLTPLIPKSFSNSLEGRAKLILRMQDYQTLPQEFPYSIPTICPPHNLLPD